MRDSVIIIATEGDIHALTVVKRLEVLGAKVMLIDTGHYPGQCVLSQHLSEHDFSYELRIADCVIASDALAGVWWRRPNAYAAAMPFRESLIRKFVADECRDAFEGWLHGLGDIVINRVSADDAASRKPYQLQAARIVGLRVPDTLITNSPTDARSFIDVHANSAVVFKSLSGSSWQTVETRRLTEDAERMMDAVALAPVIFQHEIHDKLDIRVNVIDENVFAASIHTSHPSARLDWRLDAAARCYQHELPDAVSAKLIELLKLLGLRFGAVDLVLSAGEYTFLEINPSGQWLFVEILTGQEISWAIARALLSPVRH